MGFGSILGKIAGIAVDVVTKLLPLMDLIKELVPGLAKPIEQAEELVDGAGELADDLIDSCRDEFEIIGKFGSHLGDVGEALRRLVDTVLAAADDDTVSTAELGAMKTRVLDLYEEIADLVELADQAKEAVVVINAKNV